VPIKWPKSRDEVWKANIPHTHLAHEKSDQNWMVDAGEKIVFPGGGTHFHYGADKYIASIANVFHSVFVLLIAPFLNSSITRRQKKEEKAE
jgi:Putative S-adenosyl-L-methionine-dependent methyltransferase